MDVRFRGKSGRAADITGTIDNAHDHLPRLPILSANGAGLVGVTLSRTGRIRSPCCCARATSGHAAAAPPMS